MKTQWILKKVNFENLKNMKKLTKAFLLVACCLAATLPAWSQASTEGKDFWVANTIVCQPPSASSPAFPTIAVSAQKACRVTITDYAGNQLAAADVAAGSWTRFGDNTAAVDPAEYYLDPSKWYPTTNNVNATDVYNHADKTNNYGLHITATEKISVFVIMRTPQYSMDASNALPVTALQSEYYLQDFYPDANGVDKPVTMTTILATENDTKVEITPKGNTYGKNNNGIPFTITLNKGQTYYLISEVNSQLAGTHIEAQKGKKIAVYVGSPVTRLPGGVAARDGLFEQMMPTDYWGTQFIATRSLQKDANFIGITATQNGTELKIDGFSQTYLDEGETYYILLQGPADPYSAKQSNITCHIDQIITADAAYIETSCPCAVISYDTGNSFAGKTGSEIVDGQGDPSSVWLSPIQQNINHITFGACYTTKTQAHFLNVITETATCQNTTLTAYMGQTGADWSDRLSWTEVPGNPKYSYARVQIGNKTPKIKVFTLENSKGFIAHVYGNGEDESYAYSAGSAAVVLGVKVDGVKFSDGYVSDTRFCIGSALEFDANVGTDTITRVDWDFGDGITDYKSTAAISHEYTVPGWYDVVADLYGHQVCTYESEQYFGKVKFSFLVVRPDTILVDPQPKKCLTPEEQADTIRLKGKEYLDNLLANGRKEILNPDAPCYETRLLSFQEYGLITDSIAPLELIEEHDSAFVHGRWWKPEDPDFPSDSIISWVEGGKNQYGCDSTCTLSFKLNILQCLNMDIPKADYHICPGENFLLPFTVYKGKPGEIRYISGDTNIEVSALYNEIEIPTNKMSPGSYKARITVQDDVCDSLLNFPIDLMVYYPSDIFKFKFNNVLAVYQAGYGGNKIDLSAPDGSAGYTFTGYQWYYNGAPIANATTSVYHTAEALPEGEYYVILKRADGLELPSCPQEIKQDPDFIGNQPPAAATKRMVNNRLYIILNERVYDSHGQRIK